MGPAVLRERDHKISLVECPSVFKVKFEIIFFRAEKTYLVKSDKNAPRAFARVSFAMDWILDTIISEGSGNLTDYEY